MRSDIKIWKYDTKNCIRTLEGHRKNVNALIILRSRIIASASSDQTIRLWQQDKKKCILTLRGHYDEIDAMIALRKWPAIASGSKDERIKIWNFDTSKCLRSFRANKNGVHALHLLPNGQLVSGSRDEKEGAIKIWKPFTGECVRSLSGPCTRADYFCSNDSEDLMITASPDMSLMFVELQHG
jgi:WD40 repeat protein